MDPDRRAFLSDLPIVDAHHHFWDLSLGDHYPWLQNPPWLDFRYGDYAGIRRRYLLADYAADSHNHNVVATVHMEAEYDSRRPLDEIYWLDGVRQEHGRPTVAIGQVWLDRDDVAEVLQQLAQVDWIKGVRHKPASAPSAAAAKRGAAGSMDDRCWRDGYALLAGHDLTFELQTPHWHFDAASALAEDFPAIPIAVNHTGLPADRSREGLLAWRRDLERVAQHRNVHVKISGLGVSAGHWPVGQNQGIVRDAISIFGFERCMFASNFPVDGLCADFDTILSAFKAAVADRPERQINALFCGNASSFYRLALDSNNAEGPGATMLGPVANSQKGSPP